MSQYYVTEAENEYVILGNSAIMKCKIPSFVADFVQVDAWIADDGKALKHGDEDHGSVYLSKEQPIELYFERTFDILILVAAFRYFRIQFFWLPFTSNLSLLLV